MPDPINFPLPETNFPYDNRLHRNKSTPKKRYAWTDLGNAQWFVAENKAEIRWVEPLGKWRFWTKKKWALDENGEIERRAKNLTNLMSLEARTSKDESLRDGLRRWSKRSQSRQALTNMIELAKSEQGITLSINDFDRDPYMLNFTNGTLDLRTGILKPHDPNDYISRILDFDYDPLAKCPLWENFLSEIMEHDQSKIDFLRRAIGYSLTGDTSEQKVFFCCGSGANGKSVFFETILRAMGDGYGSNAQGQTILENLRGSTINNDVARLRGLRLVTINEIRKYGDLDEGKLKELTGEDTITARFLFREFFTFHPEFKIWVRTNRMPAIKETDHGIWRRILLIPFNVVIPDDMQDKQLKAKLLEELPGILAWAVRGCLEWQDKGLEVPLAIQEATREYRGEQDVLKSFVDTCIEKVNGASEKASVIYNKYMEWATENGEIPMTSTSFGKGLSERGFRKERKSFGNVYLDLSVK